MAVKWLDEPENHDYGAAADYLTMVAEPDRVDKTVAALRDATTVYRKAKDILRAARLGLLPETNPHVKADLAKIKAGKKLSPILLVRPATTTSMPSPRAHTAAARCGGSGSRWRARASTTRAAPT